MPKRSEGISGGGLLGAPVPPRSISLLRSKCSDLPALGEVNWPSNALDNSATHLA